MKDKLPGGSRKRGRIPGGGNDGKDRVTDVEGIEDSRRNSYLHPEVNIEGVVESVPSQEANDIDGGEAARVYAPPTPMPPISQGRKLEST